VEYEARRKLQEAQRMLVGLYPGQPARATDQPTTERLLLTFKHITLTIVHTGKRVERFITPLSDLQTDILKLLRCPRTLYATLTAESG